MSSRVLYPAGGAFGTWNSITLQARDDWAVADDPALFDLPSNTRGKMLSAVQDFFGKITIQPKAFASGLVAFLNKLCPYQDIGSATVGRGNSIFPATDLPFVIQTKDGKSLTYSAAQVTKQPALTFHSAKPLIGSMEFSTVLAAGTLLTAAGSYVTEASSAFTEPTADPATEVFDRYVLNIAATTLTPDDSGIIFTPSVTLEKIKGAMATTGNWRISDIGAMIEFTPLDMDVDTFYSTYFPPTAVGLGQPIIAASQGVALSIVGSATGKLQLTVPQVAPAKPGGPRFSAKNPRQNKVQLMANHKFATGTYSPLFSFGTVP